MDIQNLKDVFQKFAVDHNRAILVDGAWGIGKTYYVLQFLKEFKQTKNKQKIAYVSLFGKTSIDEVHTEIYSRLHPVKQNSKRIIQIIPKVAPLLGAVGDIVSSLEFALKDGESISGTQTTDAKENQTTDAKIIKLPTNPKVTRSIGFVNDFAKNTAYFQKNVSFWTLQICIS